MRFVCLFVVLSCLAGCDRGAETEPSTAAPTTAEPPRDAQHQGLTGPHGDHTPHHGGMVLMNGDVHYEVVLTPSGRHEVWFSDAMRNELPASIASNVAVEVIRPGEAPEPATFTIDDAGEAWVATTRPLAGDEVTVKLRYSLQGEPHEIELPFTPAAAPQ